MTPYSADELKSFDRGRKTIPRQIRKRLFHLQIWLPGSHHGRLIRSRPPLSEPGVRPPTAPNENSDTVIKFGCLNVRSIAGKVDILLDIIHLNGIGILMHVET